MSAPVSRQGLYNLLFEGLYSQMTTEMNMPSGEVSVLYLDIDGFNQLELDYGPESSRLVLQSLWDALMEFSESQQIPGFSSKAFHLWDSGFLLLSSHEQVGLLSCGIERRITAIENGLNERVGIHGLPWQGVRYGVASTRPGDVGLQAECILQPGRLFDAVMQAVTAARRHPNPHSLPVHLVEELRRIVEEKDVNVVYQPIWNLESQSVLGWECLSRGPAGSELERPLDLFDYAQRSGCLLALERICRDCAIRTARVDAHEKLFINISPRILADASFREVETRMVVEEMGLSPSQIVFEITEHHAIRDYSAFLQLVDHYRNQGYRIAIDDVGAGHSGLVTLMQVKPDFVKIDMELIRGIENNQTKQDIVRAIGQISAGFSATVIAEGIETPAELEFLRQLGIDFGQGFLLGKPGPQTSCLAS
ncbi:EAL domain-containing protein [Alicyclobacillus tolerans]|uniref:EAL domain-containing protein n=1 Tax=Alicyclobacillus tolerans TaxID=90970 RepID=UPI001F20D227|nr:EAL domain-containing protein [Alicyclobacillus tolerans]MCF8566575.1 EAL domain-containing protein [Alicyclobacillus tolerans]